ncbi:HEPN/Toprim-associated domain-containing protein [Mucilaginibacter aquaedulcis]|uniref:HEPN/Toprim-associated domain-containing protein n=1 Tax=Mucilaginibacter aquaedulcis TaxID=1187081 RepID=UPI0025B47394|nr:HEPN/Toprim-associated domain-containing protein [Mucilaginibacter aquaedulcis]MDN3549329.1 HEPN/Toprim-associated domain-containing protein [Mucilaginibacter aquaedulcis]
MSSYGELAIGNINLLSCQNHAPDFLSLIFSRENIHKFYVDEDRNLVTHRTDYETYWLVAKSSLIHERLKILGYTEVNLQTQFKKFIIDKVDDLINDCYAFDDNNFKEKTHIELFFWQNLTLEKLRNSLVYLLSEGFSEIIISESECFNSIENYLTFSILNGDLLLSLPFNSYLFGLLFVVICSNGNSQISFDFTELYNGGYLGNDCDNVISDAKFEKIILITEGSTDISILEPSLKLLYPAIQRFYSFFDFSSFNKEGGAGGLANMVKAFAGAGISNRMIFIFDNDTAAKDAQRSLINLRLPQHFKIMNYPYLESAQNYPTVGPNGLVYMDVNGLAGSIEMYLGEDILKNEKDFTPVHWKGYIESCKAYQGEIQYKRELQLRFYDKVAFAKNSIATIGSNSNWDDLREIFKTIFEIFEDLNPKHFY